LSFINADQFVSGSWDATAIVWSISQGTKLLTLSGHQHAVTVQVFNNYVITGSQDKALNLWDLTTGKLIKRLQNAHDDIIR
jgi:WD40 repeat protein